MFWYDFETFARPHNLISGSSEEWVHPSATLLSIGDGEAGVFRTVASLILTSSEGEASLLNIIEESCNGSESVFWLIVV